MSFFPAKRNEKYITVSRLATTGRFGNQLFQYAFAKAYAESVGAILQTPKWIGQEIFEIDDPLIDRNLPPTLWNRIPYGKYNIDLQGYAQSARATSILSRSKLKKWFKFKEKYNYLIPSQSDYIAAHIRRGDYMESGGFYKIIDKERYIEACEKFGLDISKIIWVSEEEPRVCPELEKELDFLPDFMMLLGASVILRANSTFSWWAATLSNAEIYSPVIEKEPIEFIKGNHPKFVVYPDVDDIILKE